MSNQITLLRQLLILKPHFFPSLARPAAPHNLCLEQKYENYQKFLSETFQFLQVKVSIYLNRRVFVMRGLNFKWSKVWLKGLVIYSLSSGNENMGVSRADNAVKI